MQHVGKIFTRVKSGGNCTCQEITVTNLSVLKVVKSLVDDVLKVVKVITFKI